MWYCVCHVCVSVCVCVCVRARARACVMRGGGTSYARACLCACVRGGCFLTIHQMGTADAEIPSTQRLQALFTGSLLRNDVHFQDFMHLIILASQATVTVTGLGLYCCVLRHHVNHPWRNDCNLFRIYSHVTKQALKIKGNVVIYQADKNVL